MIAIEIPSTDFASNMEFCFSELRRNASDVDKERNWFKLYPIKSEKGPLVEEDILNTRGIMP